MTPETNPTTPATAAGPLEPERASDADAGWVTARPPRPREILERIVRLPQLLNAHRDLVGSSVKRELDSRFRGTLLGWLWPLVHPLFLFVVYYFIFTKLLNFKIKDLPPGQEAALGVYMFCGIAAWATVSETLTRGTTTIVDNGNLIKKLSFPSEVLPLNLTLVGLVTLSFSVVVFLLTCLLTPLWSTPGPAVAWIPLILFLQGLFTYGLALLLSTLQVFLRDTLQVVGIMLTVWMFATPLFWVPELMGDSVEPYLGMIRANPIYHLVQAWRGALMGEVRIDGWVGESGEVHPDIVPVSPDHIPAALAVFALWAVGAYVIGYAVFVMAQRRFADEV